jgi:hypothetical protein
MKSREVVCRRQFLNLRCKRDVRAPDNAKKIGARFKVRAARDPEEQRQQWEKTVHMGHFSERGGNDKHFNLHKMAAPTFMRTEICKLP